MSVKEEELQQVIARWSIESTESGTIGGCEGKKLRTLAVHTTPGSHLDPNAESRQAGETLSLSAGTRFHRVFHHPFLQKFSLLL
jgi:hypothetical protein